MFAAIKGLFEIKILKSALALTGGRFFYLAVSASLLLIQARFIGPDITGFCQAFAIPLGYLWILTLGVPSALARELPYYLAVGERDRALRYTTTAQSFSIVMGCLCASVFIWLSASSLIRGDYLSAIGWGFQIIASFLLIYGSYIETLYRTTDEFIKIAKSNTIAAISTLVAFPLIFWHPYLGIWTKNISGTVTSTIYLYLKRPFRLGFAIEMETLRQLARFGLPLIAITYIEASLWTSTQLSLIYKIAGSTNLGLFVFVQSILNALLIIPDAVADILRPRFVTVYGESNGNIQQTLKIAIKPLALALIASTLIIIAGWLFLDEIIVWLLPKYVDAIPAIGIALLIVPVMTVHCIKYIFVVCKNLKYNLLSTAPGYLVSTALLYMVLSNNTSIKYFFLPYLIGQLINLVVTVYIIAVPLKKKGLENEFTG